MRAAIARRENAERTVVAMDPREALFAVGETRRPHQRAVAEYPHFPCGLGAHEIVQRHIAVTDYAFAEDVNRATGRPLEEADPHWIAFWR